MPLSDWGGDLLKGGYPRAEEERWVAVEVNWETRGVARGPSGFEGDSDVA